MKRSLTASVIPKAHISYSDRYLSLHWNPLSKLRISPQSCASARFWKMRAEAEETDAALKTLLQIEVGEWLDRTAREDLLSQWLGERTKRICGYVPGLATQRRALNAEREKGSLRSRLFSLLNRFRAG
jgi:hypothetical protein